MLHFHFHFGYVYIMDGIHFVFRHFGTHSWYAILIFGLSKERPILGDHPKAHIHEIWQISRNPADFMWNPPTKLINQIFQEKLFSFMECCGKAMSCFHMKSAGFHEICWISQNLDFMWNPPDFERPIARNSKPYVFLHCRALKFLIVKCNPTIK